MGGAAGAWGQRSESHVDLIKLTIASLLDIKMKAASIAATVLTLVDLHAPFIKPALWGS